MKQLTQEYQELADEFADEYEARGCTCFLSPPCSYCIHPGNPDNLAETPEAWEDSGERHYPEVGMSFCGCGGSYTGNRFDDDKPSTVRSYSTDRATTVQTHSTYEAPPLVLPYSFIKHQTEKAILFAMQDNNGIYQQWIPRSVILAMTSTQVTIQGWFKSRLL